MLHLLSSNHPDVFYVRLMPVFPHDMLYVTCVHVHVLQRADLALVVNLLCCGMKANQVRFRFSGGGAILSALLLLQRFTECSSSCLTAPRQELSALLLVKAGDVIGDCGLQSALQSLATRLPNVKNIVVNIGSNIDPVVSDRADVASVAFEPIVPHLITAPHRQRLLIVPAAVSSSGGISQMHLYGRSGRYVASASSLSTVGDVAKEIFSFSYKNGSFPAAAKKKIKMEGTMRTVPLVSMRAVMDAIPPGMQPLFLKTDMQGFDFQAIRSVGADLTRFHYVKNEVDYSGNIAYQTAASTRNDFCLDLLPHMTRLGFRFLQLASDTNILMHKRSQADALCARGEAKERLPVVFDAYWISPRCNSTRPPVIRKEWPSLSVKGDHCQVHKDNQGTGFETAEVKDAIFRARRGQWVGYIP